MILKFVLLYTECSRAVILLWFETKLIGGGL